MKSLLYLTLSLVLATCSTSNENVNKTTMSEYSGLIEPQGITSYQYGTHTLETEDNYYALKSESVNLENYEGKKVTLSAEPIEGYPVDGGPDYLLVKKIKE